MKLWLARAFLSVGFILFGASVFAAEWKPTQTVRLIVPAQGGTVDLIGRLAAEHLQQVFGVPVIVDPRPGAGGNLATDLVAKAPPDGCTILVAFTAPITVNITLMGNLSYDPLKDLTPITLAVSTPQFLTVSPTVPAKTVKEFVAYAKANPGKLNYGSVSVGSASHLTMEMFNAAAGINMLHIPYKGATPVVNELLAGRLQAAMLVPANVMPYLPDGKLRVLATTGRERFSIAPRIPTLIESGYPDFEATAWIGFMAPGKTPKAIIDRYHDEIVKAIISPAVREKLNNIYFNVVASTPEEFGKYIRWETPRWAKIIRETGAKAN